MGCMKYLITYIKMLKEDKRDTGRESLENEIVRKIGERHHLTAFSRMQGGHLNVPIYSCSNRAGERLVVKFGVDDSTKKEVDDNVFGYEQIEKSGAEILLPPNLLFEEVEGFPAIIMKHLGETFSQRAKLGDVAQYRILAEKLGIICNKPIPGDNSGNQRLGLNEVTRQLDKWLGVLAQAGLPVGEAVSEVQGANLEKISSSACLPMIFDFTPDNVFINDGLVSFIDPWRQLTYVGSPIPSIAQFITLSDSVYHLPAAAENRKLFEELSHSTGKILGLDDDQITRQFKLGVALQLSLSAFVRINANPQLSRELANKCVSAILEGLER